MQYIEPVTYGNYYHIYNRGIDSCNLFQETDNYEYFLSLYDKYLSPVAETYAWVLMPNHFHILVRVKEEEEVAFDSSTPDRVLNPVRGKVGNPSQQLSKLFNSYAQAFNKRYGRHGNLFERPFKRKLIDNESYLKQVILYIHNNPVHHKFCDHPIEYPWSSYLTCVSVKSTKLKRDLVLGWFDDQANFKFMHNQKIEIEKIEDWLKID
jgi:REP element-mobilizing transposase RayT